MNSNIPILTYHQVGTNPKCIYPVQSVSPNVFSMQMKVLKKLGFSTINLDELYRYRMGRFKIPKKPIVITFDDGLQEAIDNSTTVLKQYGFTAVYYIPTDYIGKKSEWLMDELGFELPIIDLEKIKWLDTNGFQIGCHSMSHPHLDQLPKDNCFNELKSSKTILEDIIGHQVNHLAYPYGSYNESVMDTAKEAGFDTACTTDSGLCKPKYDSLCLPRINIGYHDSIIDFVTKIHLGFNPYDLSRFMVRKIRNRIGIN